MARRVYRTIASGGILGVYRTEPEVVGVYPSLSSSLQVLDQELHFVRGDSCDIGVQLQDDWDPPNSSSLHNAVVRFGVAVGYGKDDGSSSCFTKTSSDPLQIELTDPLNGRAVIHLRQEDTKDLPLGPITLRWDLEVSKSTGVIEVPTGSQVQLQAGSNVLFSPQNIWQDLGLYSGYLVRVQGRLVRVVDVLNAAQLQVDFSAWTTELTTEFSVFKALVKTVARGPLTVDGDVVI